MYLFHSKENQMTAAVGS